MKPNLIQKQKVERKMTQTLLQSIQILQLSGMELIDYIKEIADENPLIEEVYYNKDVEYSNTRSTKDIPVGEINESVDSFYTQLKQQMYSLSIPDCLQSIVEYGIDSLTTEGYLEITLEEWASACDTRVETVEEALSFIQTFEPLGIGARTLGECLYLQLKDTITFPHLKYLLENELELIADKEINMLASNYEVTKGEIESLIEAIKTCDPHPGSVLETTPPEYILPEARIVKQEGQWMISLYNWSNPSIKMDASYESLLDTKKEISTYLKTKYRQIDWLKQSISYRTNTLEMVLKVILRKQHLFFEHGDLMLKPLTLREVAEDLELSTSTISRTINHKFVETTHGILPLKFFLQTGLKQRDGQVVSTYSIKKLILEAIKYEDKSKPLSDEKIKDKLKEEFGIHIARRTVMKYRNQLHILSSTKRKQRR